ncbi:zinc finger protein [Loa loa]|uniref:Zinc finger protein n=1 Tax=Loa loa TaxID=7209 RepID=A0A1S0UB20_LOALO|nr:zinc finger protein [Loa loa]EFO27847.2 zinc finger protein [Loa loa]
MALALLSVNICQFSGCGLNFGNLHDLLQHIEETHIPIIEEEMKKKEESTKNSSLDDDPTKAAALTAVFPISAICKLFSKLPPHKAVPVNPEPVKLAIGHYRPVPWFSRKKTLAAAVAGANPFGQAGDKSRFDQHDEESNDSYRNEDCDDYEQGTDERRHKCPVEGCNKRYKNLQGARYHARQVHGYTEDNGANSAVSFDLTAVVPGQVAPLIQSGAPSKYANLRPYKCSQCSKRYKTIVGLNNHVQQSHQRINNTGNPTMSTNLVPVSPSAVAVSSTHNSVPPPATSTHVTAETDEHMVAPSGYLASTNIQNATQVRINTQPLQSPPSVVGQQYQQQPGSATKLVPTANSMMTRNMNALSSYGPQTSESLVPVISRPNTPQKPNQAGYNK